MTLPATRVAVAHLDVAFVTVGRGIGAGLAALLILLATRSRLPARRDLAALAVASAGVVIGFPFLTSLAMTAVPASHGAIVVGLLPLTTAICGALLAGERPSAGFWIAGLAGAMVLAAFVGRDGFGAVTTADLALIGAVASAAIGYALGGRLAVRLGGWQVICWALTLSLPILLVAMPFLTTWPGPDVPWQAWSGFAYITFGSQLFGFFAWYHGLAVAGIARVGQVQYLQIFLTLLVSSLLFGEVIEPRTVGYAVAVVAVVIIGTRMRVRRRPEPVRVT